MSNARERPILFSGPMVRAILEGRKTMTRRVVKPDIVNGLDICRIDGPIAYIDWETGDSYAPSDVAPYQPGQTLWVRETWARVSDWADVDPAVGLYDGYIYRADWGCDESPKWRLSIHMPRSAARLFLRVTNVRLERLQEISDEDAVKEGCADLAGFRAVWDALNAKRGFGWGANPWVWVVEFERTATAEEVAK